MSPKVIGGEAAVVKEDKAEVLAEGEAVAEAEDVEETTTEKTILPEKITVP
jgi:hypothetical protein